MSEDFSLIPIKAKVEGVGRWGKIKQIQIKDSKVFKREENKIEDVGITGRKKFVFVCNGNEPSTWKEAISFDDKIRKLEKLKQEGILTESQYEKGVNKILENDL